MTPNKLKRALAALVLCWASLAYPACVGTPLPDPPSFANALVSGAPIPQSDTIRLVGHYHAVTPAGTTLRITTPPSQGVLVATNADGSFGRIVPGAVGTAFYVEFVEAGEDRFVGAYVLLADGSVVPATAGPDMDGDGTPDAIDCAATDATMSGQRCTGRACGTDSDCASGMVCVAGACGRVAGCVPTAEICNGIDDDCDGVIDDGDPNGGVSCTTGPNMCGVFTCNDSTPPDTQVCMVGPHVDHETCGNGIDDDCNGIIDDGCP